MLWNKRLKTYVLWKDLPFFDIHLPLESEFFIPPLGHFRKIFLFLFPFVELWYMQIIFFKSELYERFSFSPPRTVGLPFLSSETVTLTEFLSV